MVDPNDGAPPESRPPQLADLLSLCRSLNREAVRYVVVGGMAMIQARFVRATENIDLLVDADRTNLNRLRTALLDLPDQAVREMEEDDLDRYVVVATPVSCAWTAWPFIPGLSFGETPPSENCCATLFMSAWTNARPRQPRRAALSRPENMRLVASSINR